MAGVVREALNAYADEVRGKAFPDEAHSFGVSSPGNATPSSPNPNDEPGPGGYGPM